MGLKDAVRVIHPDGISGICNTSLKVLLNRS